MMSAGLKKAFPTTVSAILLLCMGAVWAEDPEKLVSPRTNGGFVLDNARMLSNTDIMNLNQDLANLEKRNGCEMAVVTINSTDKVRPREYAFRLFSKWGIGKKGLNNGVLFLIVKNDRKTDIMTGDGVRPLLTDDLASDILKRDVVPQMRNGRYAAGIITGTRSTIAVLNQYKPGVSQPAAPIASPGSSSPSGTSPLPYVAGIAGIGLAGAWWWSSRKSPCKKCGKGNLKRLDDSAAIMYLNEGQKTERSMGHRNYMVYECDHCQDNLIVPGSSSETACPGCSYKTIQKSNREVEAASFSSQGRGVREQTCQNCRWTQSEDYVIPMLVAAASSDWDSNYSSSSYSSSSYSGSSSYDSSYSSSDSSWSSSSSDSSWSSSSDSSSGWGGGDSSGGGASESW